MSEEVIVEEGAEKPIRINKYLALSGIESRRTADELIAQGRVTLNGSLVTEPGVKISSGDFVKVDDKRVQPLPTMTVLLNKPRGFLCSRKAQGTYQTIYDLLPPTMSHLTYAGRLDADSEGLVIMSNDGDLVQKITHPSEGLEKEYWVTLDQTFDNGALLQLLRGVTIPEGFAKAKFVNRMSARRAQVILEQGLKRQVRSMFQCLGLRVTKLVRVRIGSLWGGDLEPGRWTSLTPETVALALKNPPAPKDWFKLEGHQAPKFKPGREGGEIHPQQLQERLEKEAAELKEERGLTKFGEEESHFDRFGKERSERPRRERNGEDQEREFRPRLGSLRPRFGDDRPRFDRDGERPRFGGDRPRFGGDRPRFGDKPRFNREGDRPRFGGDRPSFGDKPRFNREGDRPRFGGDRPSFGDKPRFNREGDRPRFGGDRPSFGDKPRFNREGDRPRFGGDRPSFGDKPRFNREGDRPRFGGDRPSFGDKPRFNRDGDRPSFGDKPRFSRDGDRPRFGGDRPSFGDKPRFNREGDRPRFGGDRPSFGDKPRFNREGDRPRFGGDRPSFGDKPRFNREGDRPRFGGDRPSFGDKPRFNREGDRPRFGGDRPRFGDKPRFGGDRPRFGGDRPRQEEE